MTSTHAGALASRREEVQANPLALGGWLSAVGAASVVVTTAFYAISPPAAAGPVQPLDVAAAMSGALTGAATLKLAGTVGIFGDVVWASAALMIAGEFGRRGRGLPALGWSALLISIVLFTFIDGMTGYVFPQLAASGNTPAFEGFRRLWDMLFLLGTATYGAGLIVAFGGIVTGSPPVGRGLSASIALVGLIALAASIAGFLGVTALPTDKIQGAMIGIGSALLIPASLQIARARG